MRKIFVTGISTDVGKTIISSILTEALQADYWKPIQTGLETDSEVIKSLISNKTTCIHKESYHLPNPLSPHSAAEISGVEIALENVNIPNCNNKTLIIEGAGGLMVPLNRNEFIIDLIIKVQADVVLVVKNYLGSINHTLLSVEIMKSRKINIIGIIFNGASNPSSENLILDYTGLKCIGRVNEEKLLDKAMVIKYSNIFESI